MSGYRGMTPEEFVDYLVDEGGLVEFVDVQLAGVHPRELSDWQEVTRRIRYLSQKQWEPTAGLVEGIYATQRQRRARAEAA